MPFLQRQSIKIHYEVKGSGQPLVLLHSFLCSRAMWNPQLPALSGQYQVINIDLRGHGKSIPIAADYNLYDLVEDVLAVLDHLQIEKAIWVGLSVGGMIALRAALQAPSRVTALILLDTDAGQDPGFARIKYAAMGFIAKYFGLRLLYHNIRRQMFGKSSLKHKPLLIRNWSQQLGEMHIPSALKMLRALQQRDDISNQLATIKQPSLVLVGSEDKSLPPARSRHIASQLPNATLKEIPHGGHLITLEQPEIVTSTLLQFLQSLKN